MTAQEIHVELARAYLILAALYGRIDGVSCDSAFAIGEATGVLAKAKALVGRDVDQGGHGLTAEQAQAWFRARCDELGR